MLDLFFLYFWRRFFGDGKGVPFLLHALLASLDDIGLKALAGCLSRCANGSTGMFQGPKFYPVAFLVIRFIGCSFFWRYRHSYSSMSMMVIVGGCGKLFQKRPCS